MEISSENTFVKYGTPFQEKLVLHIIQDRVFAEKMGEVLDPSYFDLKSLQAVSKIIFEYRKEYKEHPSLDTIATIVNLETEKAGNHALSGEIAKYLIRVDKGDIKKNDADWVKHEAFSFCKKQKLIEAMIVAKEHIKDGTYEQISRIFAKAMELGDDEDYGKDVNDDFDALFAKHFRNTIPTGWDHMNSVLNGGLAKGEVGICMAVSGAGKSWMLCHLGASAWERGYNVLHYTLEMDENAVFRRYASILTGIESKQLDGRKEEIKEQVSKFKSRLSIKRYSAGYPSLETIRMHLEKYSKNKVKPDMIVIDYDELMRLPSRTDHHKELGQFYTELVGMANEYEIAIWIASQTNRTGVKAEVVGMDNIASSYAKVMPAHFIFSLQRTPDDRNNNTATIHIAKNRYGPDGHIWTSYFNPGAGDIHIIGDSTPEDKDPTAGLNIKKQKELLLEKYKKGLNS